MHNRKLLSAGLIIFCPTLIIILLSTSIWFRLKLAGFYEQKGFQQKAMTSYAKILRKSELKNKNFLTSLFKKIYPKIKDTIWPKNCPFITLIMAIRIKPLLVIK